MTKQCLDVQQMQHLQELGLDTSNASMLYCDLYDEEYILVESKHRFDKEENAILLEGIRNSVIYCKKVTPAYTLQDVLDALPSFLVDGLEYWLEIGKEDEENWYMSYREIDTKLCSSLCYVYEQELIDAAYSLLCWCIENKFVETDKNE